MMKRFLAYAAAVFWISRCLKRTKKSHAGKKPIGNMSQRREVTSFSSGSVILEDSCLTRSPDRNQSNVTLRDTSPVRSQPISINHAPVSLDQTSGLTFDDFLPDGTRVKYVKNNFGEIMPHIPEHIRPHSSMKEITTPLGTRRWNPITGSWIDSGRNSSRGTWGRFKDKQRLKWQEPCDEANSRGLFATEAMLGTGLTTTKSKVERRDICDLFPHAIYPRRMSGEPVNKKRSGAAMNPLNFDELRRLAAANESAIESYRSDEDDSGSAIRNGNIGCRH